MPFAKFLKPYPGYTVGQVIDLPGRLTWRLEAEGVVIRVPPPVVKKAAAKKAVKKAK